MSFDLLKGIQSDTEFLSEAVALFEQSPELLEMVDENGDLIQESVEDFVKDAREFLRNGLLSHYNKKPDSQKDDENDDGEVKDPPDKLYYFAKMIGGLIYYMKKDIRSKNKAAFNQIKKGLIKDSFVDGNVKSMAEKNLKSFVEKAADHFKNNSVKQKLEQYLDQIEGYFVKAPEPEQQGA